jgi:hypothetical protein
VPEHNLEDLSIILATSLSTASSKTVLDLQGVITQMRASGMADDAIRTFLLNDLREGGRIFGQYKNAIKNTVGNAVTFSSRVAQKEVFEAAGVKNYKWVSLSKKEGKQPCPDCADRDGDVGTWEFFTTIGLPQSGFSVCQFACNCVLEPIK